MIPSSLVASYQTDKALLIAGCDDVIEWADLSNFQRGRLLGHGYSCNTEVKTFSDNNTHKE